MVNDPVTIMLEKLMLGLKLAGRDRKKLKYLFRNLRTEIRKQALTQKAEWKQEYYLYLVETFRLALEPAIDLAVRSEEFEWAAMLKKQSDLIGQPDEHARKLVEK
jgi:hypothetical protein